MSCGNVDVGCILSGRECEGCEKARVAVREARVIRVCSAMNAIGVLERGGVQTKTCRDCLIKVFEWDNEPLGAECPRVHLECPSFLS